MAGWSASIAAPQWDPQTNKRNEPKTYIRRKKNSARSERGAVHSGRNRIALRSNGKHDPENHGSAGKNAHGRIENNQERKIYRV